MRRAVIYTRVSLDSTGEGRSVERQEEVCRKLADLRGWEVAEVASDNSISAWSGKDRPGWQRVLQLINSGEVDVVVAWHLDRMTRSMVELEELILIAEGRGVGIVTATGDIDLTTDVGRMVARILAAVARAEVERKAARQRLANAQRAKEGRPFRGGLRAFGYEQDGMTIVPEEAEAIRTAADNVLGGMSLGQVAREWNEAGLRSTSAEARNSKVGWSRPGVRMVLSNPRYAGLAVYQGEVVGEGQWPAILSREVHSRLTRLFQSPSRRAGGNRKGNRPSNLLSSLAVCGRCDTASFASTRAKNGEARYKCRQCGIVVPRDMADTWLAGLIFGALQESDIAQHLASSSSGEDADELVKEMDSVEQRLSETREDRALGLIDREAFLDLNARLTAELERLRARLLASSSVPEVAALVSADDMESEWEAAPVEFRRAVVEAMFDVTLLPSGNGRRWQPQTGMVAIPKWVQESPEASLSTDSGATPMPAAG